MDAISPEYRLEPTGPGGFVWGDWQIDDAAEVSFHHPTRAVFSIYPAPDATDLASISIYQFRARLTHVCDGFPVPEDLAALAASAINSFSPAAPMLLHLVGIGEQDGARRRRVKSQWRRGRIVEHY
jgi:hypothetical protein